MGTRAIRIQPGTHHLHGSLPIIITVGTLFSGALLFSFARLFGYIERPAGRSELLRLLGVFAVVFAIGFVSLRVRRIRAGHRGAPPAHLARLLLQAIEPQWSVPMLLVGVTLSLGYF